MLLVLRCLRWLESTLLGQFSAYFLWAVKMWPFFNRMLMAISSVCNRSSLPYPHHFHWQFDAAKWQMNHALGGLIVCQVVACS
jgi:hypothetical protein